MSFSLPKEQIRVGHLSAVSVDVLHVALHNQSISAVTRIPPFVSNYAGPLFA